MNIITNLQKRHAIRAVTVFALLSLVFVSCGGPTITDLTLNALEDKVAVTEKLLSQPPIVEKADQGTETAIAKLDVYQKSLETAGKEMREAYAAVKALDTATLDSNQEKRRVALLDKAVNITVDLLNRLLKLTEK